MFNHIMRVKEKEKEKHLGNTVWVYSAEHRGLYFLQTRHVTVNSIYIINR